MIEKAGLSKEEVTRRGEEEGRKVVKEIVNE